MIKLNATTGWGEITIGDCCLRVSYLDDVVDKLLSAALTAFDNVYKIPVKFDAEGYEYTLYMMPKQTVVHIDDDVNGEYFVVADKGVLDYGQELIDYVRKNIALCVMFPYSAYNMSALQREEKTSKFLLTCDLIEQKLKKWRHPYADLFN